MLQYGKSLDWEKEHYTTHDVASVFRRYLTQMPVRIPTKVSFAMLTSIKGTSDTLRFVS
jgi:hypothetical protein